MFGTVKRYGDAKGYGFIKCDESGEDFFVHCSQINGSKNILAKGDRVTFNVRENEKGKQAVNVTPVQA